MVFGISKAIKKRQSGAAERRHERKKLKEIEAAAYKHETKRWGAPKDDDDRKRKPVAKTLTIDGKRYTLQSFHRSKKAAIDKKNSLARAGKLVRTINRQDMHYVYARNK